MRKTEMSVKEFRERMLSIPENGKVRIYAESRLCDGALNIEAIIEDDPIVMKEYAKKGTTNQCFAYGFFFLIASVILLFLFHEGVQSGEFNNDDITRLMAVAVCSLFPCLGFSLIVVGLYRRFFKRHHRS